MTKILKGISIGVMIGSGYCNKILHEILLRQQTSTKKLQSIFFLRPKQECFDKNGQKPFFLKNIVIFCFNYVISML